MHWQGGERRLSHGRTAGRVGSSRWVSRLACAAGYGGGYRAAKALHWSSTSTRKTSTHRGLTPGPTAPSQCCVAGAANAAPTTAAAAWCGARATFPAVKLFVPPPRRRTADGCCSTPQRAGALCTTFSHGETTSAKNLVLTRHF